MRKRTTLADLPTTRLYPLCGAPRSPAPKLPPRERERRVRRQTKVLAALTTWGRPFTYGEIRGMLLSDTSREEVQALLDELVAENRLVVRVEHVKVVGYTGERSVYELPRTGGGDAR